MTYVGACIMGILKGITEFLPVSSSGHLAIFSQVFGFSPPGEHDLLFDIMLHLGTLIAVFIAYYGDILDVIKEFFLSVKDIFTGQFSFKGMSPSRRFLFMIILATLPLVLILPFNDAIEKVANTLWLVGIFLLTTGFLLLLSDSIIRGNRRENNTTCTNALTVGLFQVLGTLPGISRSGATITGGLLSGFEREYAVKFSFIMSIPAVLGASLLSFFDVIKGNTVPDATVGMYVAGIVTSAVSGYLSIRFLRMILKHDKFKYFAYYCFGMGAFVIIRSILRS